MSHNTQADTVNADCRIRDLDNYWIASSSVFLTGIAMKPTLTIGTLALRVGDYVER